MNDKSTRQADSPEQEDASEAAPESSADEGQAEATPVDQPAESTDATDADTEKPAASDKPSKPARSAGGSPARRRIETDMRQYTRSDLTRAEQALLDELAQDQAVQLLLPTSTKLDTGNWLMRGKVWAACTEDRLLMFAAGRRPHSEAVAFAQLHDSLYNHVTGQLVLAPAEKTQVRGLRLTASAAKSLLARFQTKSQGND